MCWLSEVKQNHKKSVKFVCIVVLFLSYLCCTPTNTGNVLFKTRAGVLFGIKIQARSASGFVPNKTCHVSVLNGFKIICIIKLNHYIKIVIQKSLYKILYIFCMTIIFCIIA